MRLACPALMGVAHSIRLGNKPIAFSDVCIRCPPSMMFTICGSFRSFLGDFRIVSDYFLFVWI